MKRRWEPYEEQEERRKLLRAARAGQRSAQAELHTEYQARLYSPVECRRIDVEKLLADLADKSDDLPRHEH